MTAFQSGGDIYYRAVQTIRPNTELLVWYGDDYAAELGLISVSFIKSLDLINLCKLMSLMSCFSSDIQYGMCDKFLSCVMGRRTASESVVIAASAAGKSGAKAKRIAKQNAATCCEPSSWEMSITSC